MLPMFFHAACFFGEDFKVQSRWFWPKADWDLLLPRAWINCLSELGIPTGKIQSLHVLECFSWCNPLLARLGRQHFLSEWMVTNMNQAKQCSVERHTKCRHIPIKGSQWRVTHQWRRSSRQAMYLPCRICTSDFTQTLAYPDSLYYAFEKDMWKVFIANSQFFASKQHTYCVNSIKYGLERQIGAFMGALLLPRIRVGCDFFQE